MVYSVWNQSKKAYDYYKAGKPLNRVNASAPKHIPNTKLGATLTQASWPLPAGARYLGSGEIAKGRIAMKKGFAGLGATEGGPGAVFWLPFIVFGAIYLYAQSRE